MNKLAKFLDSTFLDLGREFKWTYLPPLMVYMAAGISGLTGIVGTFFVKDYLNLSAAFLAGLGFWAGIPWALKMPLGHLVDLIWQRKNYMVYFGASLIALKFTNYVWIDYSYRGDVSSIFCRNMVCNKCDFSSCWLCSSGCCC